jgi:hypothetical protein
MAMQRKWIQTATIAVDSETGAILVTGAGGGGGGYEIVGLKDVGGDPINPATKEGVDAIAAALADPAQAGEVEAAAGLIIAALENPAQAGEADAAAGSIVTALGSPAQAGEADAAAGSVITALGSPAQEDGNLAGVKTNTDALASGLPAFGTDAAGQDAHQKVLDCPSRATHHLIAFAETNAAILSLNGGTTDHVYVPAGGGVALDGLAIPASAEVHAKNAVGGSNFVNLRVMVW